MTILRHPSQARAFEDLLKSLTPPGWRREFVMPPWGRRKAGEANGCRCCDAEKSPTWSTVVVTRKRFARETLLFTFAMVCEACAKGPDTSTKLATMVFGAEASPS